MLRVHTWQPEPAAGAAAQQGSWCQQHRGTAGRQPQPGPTHRSAAPGVSARPRPPPPPTPRCAPGQRKQSLFANKATQHLHSSLFPSPPSIHSCPALDQDARAGQLRRAAYGTDYVPPGPMAVNFV